jgi:hypothetical protein
MMYVAIVQMETPEVDHDTAVEIALNSSPKFVAAKDRGLLMKYYLINAASSGGVYFWNSKEDADAWYTPEWYEFMKETFAEPTVTFYDSFVQVDNMNDQILVDGKPQQV